jgi:hypothetical protein
MKYFFLVIIVLETMSWFNDTFSMQSIICYFLILFAELQLFGFNWFDSAKSKNVEIVWSDF